MSSGFRPPGDRASVLVVDDERDVREMMVELFESEGYEVVSAATLDESVAAMDRGLPDAIIADLKLGQSDGLELLRAARERDPDAVVILVTGHASIRTAIDALRDGAYDYIQKPFDLDVLSAVVERGLAAHHLVLENRRLVADLCVANEALRRHEEELEERVSEATQRLHDLLDVGREVTSQLDMPKTLELVVERATRLVQASAAYLYSFAAGASELVGEAAAPCGSWPSDVPRMLAGGLPYDVVLTGVARRFGPESPRDAFTDAIGATNALAVPLGFEETVLGVLVVTDSRRGAFSLEDEEQLALFALQASNAVGNASVHARLKDVERLKSDFVAMVSHEIRTPLTAIQGILGLLREAASDERGELVDIGEINAQRLLTLVTDILDFAKLEASKLRMTFVPIDVPEVIDSVVRSMRTIAHELRIEVETAFGRGLPAVTADRMRVEQVLTNLISNAIKFSSPGDTVRVSAEPEGDAVRISVADEGCGIDAGDIPKLFTKLTQLDMGTSRAAGGTGLGLVISRAIVEAHGGEIFVSSRRGQGSVFEFLLPVEPPARQRCEEGAAHPANR